MYFKLQTHPDVLVNRLRFIDASGPVAIVYDATLDGGKPTIGISRHVMTDNGVQVSSQFHANDHGGKLGWVMARFQHCTLVATLGLAPNKVLDDSDEDPAYEQPAAIFMPGSHPVITVYR